MNREGLHVFAHAQASQAVRPVSQELRVPCSISEGPTEAGCVMCYVCEGQFAEMTKLFDASFTKYMEAHKTGETRDTPATRVHDLAFGHQEYCASMKGQVVVSWFLAIAMERLVALECAGVPT